VPLSDERSVLILGDVSGKGIAAALLGAMAQGAVQAQFTSGLSIEAAITGLNRVLVQKSAADRFITLFCAVLSPDGEFVYINAGHNLPILIRKNGETELLTTKSVLLGAFDFAKYQARSTQLETGDVVVIYTDGVTEAVNGSNQMFGDDRLTEMSRKIANLSAGEIKDRILKAVVAFTGQVPQGDDITLIVLKMK
jgi:phosphoserine phosphatase RsbU/P